MVESQAEFERAYADRSGVSVDWLHTNGRSGFPCHCEEPDCEGWQMVNAADHIEDLLVRGLAIPPGTYHLSRTVEEHRRVDAISVYVVNNSPPKMSGEVESAK